MNHQVKWGLGLGNCSRVAPVIKPVSTWACQRVPCPRLWPAKPARMSVSAEAGLRPYALPQNQHKPLRRSLKKFPQMRVYFACSEFHSFKKVDLPPRHLQGGRRFKKLFQNGWI